MTVEPLIGTNVVATLGSVEVSPGSEVAAKAVLGSRDARKRWLLESDCKVFAKHAITYANTLIKEIETRSMGSLLPFKQENLPYLEAARN